MLTVSSLWARWSRLRGSMITARLGHSSVTAKSRLGHSSVTARSQLNHGPGHGSVTAGCDHFGHRQLTVSSHGGQFFFSHGRIQVKIVRSGLRSHYWHHWGLEGLDRWGSGYTLWGSEFQSQTVRGKKLVAKYNFLGILSRGSRAWGAMAFVWYIYGYRLKEGSVGNTDKVVSHFIE